MEVLKSLVMEVEEIKEDIKELKHVANEEHKEVRREGRPTNQKAAFGAGTKDKVERVSKVEKKEGQFVEVLGKEAVSL